MLSIITNFGCDTGCTYCIWRGHKLSGYTTSVKSTDWDYLSKLTKNLTEISVSGGGDPLFRRHENSEWWDKLFEVCGDTKIELHTSKYDPDWEHIYDISKYIWHMNYATYSARVNDIISLSNKVKLRIVFVVTDDFTDDMLNELSDFCMTNGIELSFRQLVNIDGSISYHLHGFLQDGHKELWYYIEQADYNLYFMPDNNVYDKYQLSEE